MSNLEKYNEVFKNVFDVDENELNDTFTFNNVEQWDSVGHLTLISKLEDIFDVMFESEDILHYESYANGKKILTKYGVDI